MMDVSSYNARLTMENWPEMFDRVNTLLGTKPFAMVEHGPEGTHLLTDLRLIDPFGGYYYHNDNEIKMSLAHTQGRISFDCRLSDHLRRNTTFTFEDNTVSIKWFDGDVRWIILRPQKGE